MCNQKGEMIMNKTKVNFKNPDDVKNFVETVEKYPYSMDMKSGRYIVDAKSLLGLMNLGLNKDIELDVYEEDCSDLFDAIKQYVAA